MSSLYFDEARIARIASGIKGHYAFTFLCTTNNGIICGAAVEQDALTAAAAAGGAAVRVVLRYISELVKRYQGTLAFTIRPRKPQSVHCNSLLYTCTVRGVMR
jgi:hypothetical protein